MTGFDLIVIAIILISAALGWQRGGVRETVTLLGIGAGFLAVALLGGPATAAAEGGFTRLAILAGLFVVGDLIVTVPGSLIVRRFFGRRKQRGDRVAGALFGSFRGWIIAAALAFTVEIYHTGTDLPPALENSVSAQPLLTTAHALLRQAEGRSS
ncbi:MAG: CvpA family protein [Parvularcula sp.]|nr:CvpA family protein [Parvularcula sp.]